MQKTMLSALLTILLTTALSAQESDNGMQNPKTDSIEIRKAFGGYQLYHEGKQLKSKELKDLLKPNEQAYKQFKSSRSSNTIATVLGYAGGFMIGWPLGTAIGGGKPNWILAGVGAGLVAVAIPISIGSNRKLKRSVGIYNATL